MIRHGLKLGNKVAWDAPGGAFRILDGPEDTGYRLYFSSRRVWTVANGNRTWSKDVGHYLTEAWRRARQELTQRLTS
jgi:hypothetical protein